MTSGLLPPDCSPSSSRPSSCPTRLSPICSRAIRWRMRSLFTAELACTEMRSLLLAVASPPPSLFSSSSGPTGLKPCKLLIGQSTRRSAFYGPGGHRRRSLCSSKGGDRAGLSPACSWLLTSCRRSSGRGARLGRCDVRGCCGKSGCWRRRARCHALLPAAHPFDFSSRSSCELCRSLSQSSPSSTAFAFSSPTPQTSSCGWLRAVGGEADARKRTTGCLLGSYWRLRRAWTGEKGRRGETGENELRGCWRTCSEASGFAASGGVWRKF
mmetsp:Transcript_44263/g.139639  ORF Transcript_44263/g.139639 Transcript_44263/m.139639 type:complete len:269 (+) Transcript_44263:1395-2201(+)